VKRIIPIICVLIIAQLACQFSLSPGATEETKPDKPAAIDFSASVFYSGTELFGGPGVDYPVVGNDYRAGVWLHLVPGIFCILWIEWLGERR
jgi:hypothetical protein